jgi:large subunit ribosomal protein L18
MRNRVELGKIRHQRVRRKVAGTAARPRMALKVTNRHMYVQFIDDTCGHTLASASSMKMDKGNNMAAATLLGQAAAKCATEVGIREVIVDRGGHQYHGRVQAIVMAVAAAGLLPGVKLAAEKTDGQTEEAK